MSHNPESRVSYGPGLPTDPLWLKAVDRVSDGLDRGTQRLFSSMATIAVAGFNAIDRANAFIDRLFPVPMENGGENLLSVIDKLETSRERLVDRYLRKPRAKNKNN